MPISIQCPACKREYKVDDKLAGKKVKCKQCGEAISVADPEMALQEPDVLGLEDEPMESAPAARGPVGGVGGGVGGGASVKRCPSCRTPNNPAAVMCVACGFSLRPEPAVVVETFGVKEQAPQKKKRKFVRDPDSPMTASIDSIVNMIVWWGSIAAVGVWVVHIARSMGGLAPNYLFPLGVVIAAGVFIIAPLMMIAIKVAARFAEFIPRNDTFNRVMLSLLPPFAASLLAGWPGLNAQPIVVLAWLASPALFIYLFRSEVKEWISTVGAGIVALFIGWWIAGMAASAAGSAMGGLYADMLPDGPWQSFATSHSPPPAPAGPEKIALAPTPPSPVRPATTTPDTLPFMPMPAGANPTGSNVAGTPGSGHEQVAIITPQPSPNSNTPPGVSPTPGPSAVTPGGAPGPSFFADVSVEDKNLQDVREIIAPPPPAPWMLVVKGSDSGSVTAERWSVQPAVKKGVQTFSELPKQPNCYALSPNGSTLVAVVHFPKNQLQISTFDNKPPRTFPLEEGRAAPTLMGFIDNTHVCLRWEEGGMNKVQVVYTYSGATSRTIPVEMLGGSREEVAISPNGRLMAMFSPVAGGVQQIVIINTDTGVIVKKITPTSSQFTPLGLAFSPDSTQIALYAVVSDVTTLLSFKVQTGAPAYSGMIGAAPEPNLTQREAAHPPGLLWLQNGLAWLINGNDLYDTTSGKKIGSLALPDLVDVHLAGPDSIAFVQTTAEGTKKATIAKLDDGQIREAAKAKE